MTTTLRATDRFGDDAVTRLRRRAVFEAGKWDPQVHDGPSLAPFALRIGAEEWAALCRHAERLWAELAAIERQLVTDRRLLGALAIPRRARTAILQAAAASPTIRFARFDFHFTSAGWRISEVNADVPGGFVESGPVTQMVADELGAAAPSDPAALIADAFARCAAYGGIIALVHATAYADDFQVMERFRRLLEARGIAAVPCSPDHLRWDDSGTCSTAPDAPPVAGVLRFFPAEWLVNLPRSHAITPFFGGRARGPVLANPATALAIQSKRLGLVLDRFAAPSSTWRALTPPVRSALPSIYSRRPIPDGWVLKPAMGRVGEGIVIPGVTAAADAHRSIRHARLAPGHWLLQERFESRPIAAPGGPRHACIGIYTVNGRAAGAYARVSSRPLIDAHAQDAALLIDAPSPAHPSTHPQRRAPRAAAGVL
ncbi:MAG TPA: glutathionylspermidine synthase family protein [Phycisphaerales bacterium]|nr:glutathionylspermidine synthase family protein [Phycisphaerales bacterium]